MSSAIGIIPSRYASTRLPGKPLLELGGQSMIQRVVGQARQAGLARVVVATDDQRILDHVHAFGGEAVLTSPTHPSGTDRVWEAFELLGQPAEVGCIINIQGDEPFVHPAQITALVELFAQAAPPAIATLIKPVLTAEARKANFTNEGGVDGRTRFLTNVMGTWLLSETLRTWEAAGEPSDLATLLAQARDHTGPVTVFDVQDPRFLPPGDMPARIAAYCSEHDLPFPGSPVALVRMRARSRRAALRDVWPDVVDNIASGVRAGLALPRTPADPEAVMALAQRYNLEGPATRLVDALTD